MTSRDTYHHGDLRSALVAAALQQLEAGGEASVSLRALAKEAGVSPNAPYRHFADKQALMTALAAEGFFRFAEAVCGAGRPGDSPVEVLKDQGRAYLEFAGSHPALYRLMFSPYGYSLHSDQCQNQAGRAFGALVETAAQAQATGWKSGQDLVAAVIAYWSALHGFAGIFGDHLAPPGVPLPSVETWLRAVFAEVEVLQGENC